MIQGLKSKITQTSLKFPSFYVYSEYTRNYYKI